MRNRISVKANPERIMKEIQEFSAISDICEEGVSRPPYTEVYRKGAEHIMSKMKAIGLLIKEDDIGNIYGIKIGSDTKAPHIITGSHLDTVYCGGAYDGVAGVMCALEAVRMIIQSGCKLNSTLEVLATIGEEGARFGTSFIGSRFIEGSLTNENLDQIIDYEGITLRKALYEYNGVTNIEMACRKHEKIKAFFELHIEQGTLLENKGVDIGIVDTINCVFRYHVKVEGVSGHSGALPMDVRRDAGIGAFLIITNVNKYVRKKYTGHATITVGQLQLFPGSLNVVPKRCEFIFDIRTGNKEILDDIKRKIQYESKKVQSYFGLYVSTEVICDVEAKALNMELNAIIENAAKELGILTIRMNSGAGHDAMIFSRVWDSALIFVPSRGGITHNPKEFTSSNDLAVGAELLAEAILLVDKT